MKARYTKPMSVTELEKFVAGEIEKRENQIFDENMECIAQQVVATFLVTLEKCYGFGKKRLKECLDNINDYCHLMYDSVLPGGKTGTTVDNVYYLKEKYGIDVTKELTFSRDKNLHWEDSENVRKQNT